jgi:hypothetical protein
MDVLTKIGGTPSEHSLYSPDVTPCDFWAFPTMKKRSPTARYFKVIDGLQHVFEKWVEHCKKCIAHQWGTLKKRPSLHLHKVPIQSNKVSPQTLQTTLVHVTKVEGSFLGVVTNSTLILEAHIDKYAIRLAPIYL